MLPILVPIVTSEIEKADVANGRINNTKLMSTWPKLIIKKCFLALKNATSAFKLKKLIY